MTPAPKFTSVGRDVSSCHDVCCSGGCLSRKFRGAAAPARQDLGERKRSSLVIFYWLIVKMIERRENDEESAARSLLVIRYW